MVLPNSSKWDVIGLGENSIDRVLVVPHLPGAAGAPSKMHVPGSMRSCGGQVATAMAACAGLGLRSAYAGVVGADEDGRLVRDTLTAHGVDVGNLRIAEDAPTRWATILVDAATGERSVLWDRDDRLAMNVADIDAIDVTSARLVHVDDADMAASMRLAASARRAGLMVTTDIDASTEAMALLQIATHPILSEHALSVLSGEDDIEQGLRTLRRHCDGVICVTLGAHGAMALSGDTLVTAPGIEIAAADTTGAGDVFRAGFIAALLSGRSLIDILTFANAAAALSCTKIGAIGGVPTLAEVHALTERS